MKKEMCNRLLPYPIEGEIDRNVLEENKIFK